MSGALEPRPARCFADAAEERTLSEDELANGVSLLRERRKLLALDLTQSSQRKHATYCCGE